MLLRFEEVLLGFGRSLHVISMIYVLYKKINTVNQYVKKIIFNTFLINNFTLEEKTARHC